MMSQNNGPPAGGGGDGGRDPGAVAEADYAAGGEITIENVAGGDVAGGNDDGGSDGGAAGPEPTVDAATAAAESEPEPDDGSRTRDAGHDGTAPPTPSPDMDPAQLYNLLQAEAAKSSGYEQKLKLALADYQNLTKRTASEIEAGVAARLGGLVSDVLGVRDDFVRARDTFAKEQVDTEGLDSILRNMDSVLEGYEVRPIDALGEIFDPNMHEAVSSEVDPLLDENTITKELRRGYVMKNTIIRPSMVVISKKE
ncbi:MAG: nucleotide exchange factor GrpE [Thaumarchaeota archaeon]|nr:nucleotide exchange factor GrpE [Nitrososphaerota archaeon]